MKSELQNKLIKRYPQFFQVNRKIYNNNEFIDGGLQELIEQKEMVLPIQFGFECGNGWYVILETLFAGIEWHLENENRNRANEFKYKWMWTLQAYLRRKHYKKEKLKAFSEWLYENAPRKKQAPLTLTVTQIKEKFGGLCFYYFGGDDEISGMVRFAESLSYSTCESCGTTNEVGQTEGWIYTVCKPCYDKNERANRLKWKIRGEKFDEQPL